MAEMLLDEHLHHLSEAVHREEPVLFVDYAVWADTRHPNIANEMETLRGVAGDRLGPAAARAITYIDLAAAKLASPKWMPDSCIRPGAPYSALASRYVAHLLEGRREAAVSLIEREIEAGSSVRDIYMHVFQPAQHEIGRLWQTNQVTVAQEHYCTAATQFCMTRLQARIFSTPRNGRKALVAGVGGELHEIGPRMVADFLEMDGWDTHFLGAFLPPGEIGGAARRVQPDLVCLSCTMTYYVGRVEEAVAAVRQQFPPAKILVGGYPFNASSALWRKIGADGHALDADAAVRQAAAVIAG